MKTYLTFVFLLSHTKTGFANAQVDLSLKFVIRLKINSPNTKVLHIIFQTVHDSHTVLPNINFYSIQWNFIGSNTDGLFTTAFSNSFLSP